jgi:hypothetical protein
VECILLAQDRTQVQVLFGYSNKLSGSIKGRKFFGKLNDKINNPH